DRRAQRKPIFEFVEDEKLRHGGREGGVLVLEVLGARNQRQVRAHSGAESSLGAIVVVLAFLVGERAHVVAVPGQRTGSAADGAGAGDALAGGDAGVLAIGPDRTRGTRDTAGPTGQADVVDA